MLSGLQTHGEMPREHPRSVNVTTFSQLCILFEFYLLSFVPATNWRWEGNDQIKSEDVLVHYWRERERERERNVGSCLQYTNYRYKGARNLVDLENFNQAKILDERKTFGKTTIKVMIQWGSYK
ncbi:unnamed protein product [Acanthoscelides obtectus]|uniref:Uncharacterized protein n=1 Tax=Acanthoscelides obtectus TaxID=200917 RepID=A0A9P0PHY1_ACAOB|nr:unnamed protein product [Acanthoscelides obtectus]CAK1638364.1 hypothetical protein AOBTE_LOCUS10565 [Acanthoscelides obtectus]